MPATLRLHEDVLSNAASGVRLPALPRMIFVVHGAVTVDGGQRFADGEAWHSDGAVMFDAGEAGATCWRFELAASGADDGAAAATVHNLRRRADRIAGAMKHLSRPAYRFTPNRSFTMAHSPLDRDDWLCPDSPRRTRPATVVAGA